jgi:hypothetical protein
LSPQEASRLQELEQIIAEGLESFLKIGLAFAEVLGSEHEPLQPDHQHGQSLRQYRNGIPSGRLGFSQRTSMSTRCDH